MAAIKESLDEALEQTRARLDRLAALRRRPDLEPAEIEDLEDELRHARAYLADLIEVAS